MNITGKLLIFTGAVLIVIGILFSISGKVPLIGKLPGDIHIQKKNFTFYFPLTTCILVSIILSFILLIISKK